MSVDHIDYAIVPKAHTSMYLMHKYWARKPHNVVAEYIKHYSNKGDIVLDPFWGSGVTAFEALKLGRKVIAVDLDPMAIFITGCSAKPINFEKLTKAYNNLRNKYANSLF